MGQVAGKSSVMMEIRTPKTHKAKRVLEKRAPKLVENGKKTLILHGTKTSATVSSVLMELYRLKKGGAIKYSRRNENIRPFESGGETSLEFFSLKTDCSIFVYGSHSKKRPDNLVLGRMYDHHVYDLIEVGIENFKSLLSFSYDKKIAPHEGSKPFICFTGEGFENVQELKQLKEVLTDLFRGEVVENLNLTGLDRAYICTAVSPAKVFLTHCAIKLKKSGTIVPRIELVEVGPSMDLVIRRNRFPNEGLRKEAMKSSKDKPKKKVKNVDQDDVLGKLGRVYIPEQEVGKIPLPDKSKGVKRERREGKVKKNKEEGSASKKLKESE
ncbi:hypothetical protein HID58_075043 [Brassica napus]|uniref:Ribosome production factor 2 homolog n=2 Tax=Brassica napus TaxID=3708 RepID=A0ABQ7YIP1_BRANA|nr:hypothetical protein HID58_075043 [Brassica napus]